MSILGTKTTDKTVQTDRKVVATYTPETIEKPDPTLPVGKTEVEQKPQTGYKVTTYQIITENGKTTTVQANTSTYKKKDKIVRVGTKPVETPPAPTGGETAPGGTVTTGGETAEPTVPAGTETPPAETPAPPVPADPSTDPE